MLKSGLPAATPTTLWSSLVWASATFTTSARPSRRARLRRSALMGVRITVKPPFAPATGVVTGSVALSRIMPKGSPRSYVLGTFRAVRLVCAACVCSSGLIGIRLLENAPKFAPTLSRLLPSLFAQPLVTLGLIASTKMAGVSALLICAAPVCCGYDFQKIPRLLGGKEKER